MPKNGLYIDLNDLRPDHLGCYGYHLNTSPNIDSVAREGVRFGECYTPDAPCLPSRTAMTSGRFGIHTGVVNHGGARSEPFNQGRDRGFQCNRCEDNWARLRGNAGYHTVAFSPFAQRHGAWHWYADFLAMHNTGAGGMETADVIAPQVEDWLQRNGDSREKPFFMWVNVWDAHTPYRTPLGENEENPFSRDHLPDWYGESVRAEHWNWPGPNSAQEINNYEVMPGWLATVAEEQFPDLPRLHPNQLPDIEHARMVFDGYDLGVSHADRYIGKIIQKLKDLGIYEDTAIIISSDHGENLGELGIYGDHQTADAITHRVPMIVRWPGITDAHANTQDDRMLYNIDMAASTLEFIGESVPDTWDGQSIAQAILTGDKTPHRDHLGLSQMAWCVQRAIRWENYILIQTWHDAFHDFPQYMLFNLREDPHEQHNLADSHPVLLEKGKAMLHDWTHEQMRRSLYAEDPLYTVLAEGGAFHGSPDAHTYLKRLRDTGRGFYADRLAKKHQITES